MKVSDHFEPAAMAAMPHIIEPGGMINNLEALALATMSQAISLKRIADALTEPNQYGEGPAAAIGGAIMRGMRG